MRKQSQGIDFFPFEIDFFSDKKIKILKARYGADGVTIYLYLLCQIYREGYYTRVDQDFTFMLSDDLNMSSDKVQQVMTFLLERSMFDEQLFKSDAILTSAGIQERWQKAVKTRALKTPIEVTEYWLLNEEQTAPFIKHTLYDDNSEKKEDNSRKKEFNSENYSQSKVKESKVNKYPPPIARAREEEFRTSFDAFVEEFGILVDTCDGRVGELDYVKLRDIYSKSSKCLNSEKYGKWMKTLSWIVKSYPKIINGNYIDDAPPGKKDGTMDILERLYGKYEEEKNAEVDKAGRG